MISLRDLILVPVLMALSAASAIAQSTIVADPGAVQLNPIWYIEGDRVRGYDHVGEEIANLGDLFGTGKGVWAVRVGRYFHWEFYRHDSDDIAHDVVPFWTSDTMNLHPLVGDFWGTGRKSLVLSGWNVDSSSGTPKYFLELYFHAVESGTIAANPQLTMNTRDMNPRRNPVFQHGNSMIVRDLDKDGADELILPMPGIELDTGVSHYPEIWIYKGGVNFQVDSPTVVIRDTRRHDQLSWDACALDFDGDGHIDILMVGGIASTPTSMPRMTFYWGNGTVERFNNENNRRTITLTDEHPNAFAGITVLDCDGDGAPDLALDRAGVYLYRSSVGKNARTRSFRMDDAEHFFAGYIAHRSGGFLNDQTKRYEMLLINHFGFEPGAPSDMWLFAGGTNGPDSGYDAYRNRAFGNTIPLDDVDGDGWTDLLVGDIYLGVLEAGGAAIYAGGPYIPSPKVSSVDAIAGEGHAQAIALWPNPVRDELHIAWRGDLQRMPRRFVVHDALGRAVASGEVPAGIGAALWHCSEVPVGVYLLSIFDCNDALITTAPIVKH